MGTKLTSEKLAEILISKLVLNSPFSNKVYSVGGFVRDDILGLESKDLDLVIELPGGAEQFTRFIHDNFSAETTQGYQMGESYPIWRISFKSNVNFNGVEYEVAGVEIDIADTQKECFPDPTTRQRITIFGTLEEDIKRRDFTTNMILRDLTTGNIVDVIGGEEDIKNGILKGHPEVSLDKMFSDDPLRMLRLIRFQTKYGWKVPHSVVKAVRRNAERITIVSGERIRDELLKIISFGKLAQAVRFMKATKLLEHVFPEVYQMIGVVQDRRYHSEGDVFVHTIMVTEKAKPNAVAQLSALFHDLGKPCTQKIEQGGAKISFHGHENSSAEMAEMILVRLKFESETVRKIKKIVANHLRGHFSKDWSMKVVRKYIRDCGDVIEDLLDLTEIDALSSYGENGLPKENIIPQLREKIKMTSIIPIRPRSILDGEEIMSVLNMKPGKEIRVILDYLNELEDDYAERGLVLSKEQAIDSLLTRAKK